MPPELAHSAKRLAAIKKAMAALEAEAAAGQQAVTAKGGKADPPPRKGKKKAGSPVQSPSLLPPEAPATGTSEPSAEDHVEATPVRDKAQYNFTDAESRIMLTSSKAFEQCYNAQAAVDSSSKIVVAADLTNQAADAPHLTTMVDQAIVNTRWVPSEISADAGYFNLKRIEDLRTLPIDDVFIPAEKIRHSQWREQKSPRGRIPKNLDTKGRMRRKLRTKYGRARYRLRQETVEPVFGQIKWNRGLRQFLLRGLAAARASWRFECTVHNLLKLRSAGLVMA